MSLVSPQPQINAAQAEGRRIYIGNLNYDLQNADVEDMLAQSGFPAFNTVRVPLDPASGRNRGYCFVDFATRDEADRAVAELQAVIGGREIKVRPCEPKQQQPGYNNGGAFGSPNPGYNAPGQRWGNNNNYNRGFDQGMGVVDGFGGQQQSDMRKLYVGGLVPMPDPAQNEEEIRMLFNGFNPTYISKRLENNRATPENPGPYHFCFVEFQTPEEATAAKDALDGRIYGSDGSQLRVNFAKPSRSQQGQGMQRGGWGRQQQQGAYNQGAYGQGGYNQGGYNQGGYNQGSQANVAAGTWRRG